MSFRERLSTLATVAVETLCVKDAEYGSSWRKRGGIGAFMMLARKWDRLETQVTAHNYDIFKAFESDDRPEGIIDDIRDLKSYLMLVEEHLLSLKSVNTPTISQPDEWSDDRKISPDSN